MRTMLAICLVSIIGCSGTSSTSTFTATTPPENPPAKAEPAGGDPTTRMLPAAQGIGIAPEK